ncbi:hypothetical protein [Glycomyces arizonensis]|uniref:hypothetical protein n=1 Tax=Glycomyces arizonensis TaxID=256035 RepID=UPI0004103471|nr:hypothetical protein [Glycomyces arizonensis]
MRERRGIRPAWTTRLVAGAAGALLATAASPAYAQDNEEATGPEQLCGLHDYRLRGASGITTAGDDGWWVVVNGENQDPTLSVEHVGADCNPRTEDEVFIDHQPRDPEALALDTDGYLWVADTGEATDRDSIALNQVEPGNLSNNVMYRFVFPDGPEETAAFLILPDVDTPVFITAGDGEANLYQPTGDMLEYDTPMEKAGAVTLANGGSVTGAALNADATKVVLRTADTAYEWPVEGGDVLGALTGGEPTLTPLADEGDAQDITYDAEGNFITLSQLDSEDTFASINKYTPAAPEAPATEDTAEAADDQAAGEKSGGGIVDFILDLGFDNIVRILAAIAVVGFIVMVGGIFAIRKSRRQRAAAEEDDDTETAAAEESPFGDLKGGPPDPVDIGLEAGQPDAEVGQIAQGGSVYGAPKAEAAGNVYGAKRAEAGGNVYGGARPEAAGSVYGAAEPKAEQPGTAYGARSEPQYGAFEGAGQGSIYNNAGESFAAEPAPPAGGTYGTPRQGGVYGAGGQSPDVESPGTVYGAGGGRGDEREADEGYWGPPQDDGRRR